MVQGTSSDVGKTLVVAALCRWFRRHGLSVAPFKSQNMALNAAVTPDGHEIGRAQAMQAGAAGLLPHVDMNPILLKPERETGCQVVVQGRVRGRMDGRAYFEHKREFTGVIADSLARLRAQHDLVIIEGAGSPAEINLRESEIVNMFVADLADAPVLLVGDVDRGGVLAALVGTLMLLEPDERARVKGLIVNKFRGDLSLFTPATAMLEARTGLPVLGVLPHLSGLRLPDEDSVAIDARDSRRPDADKLDICVLRLPHISNFDDVLALEHEPSAAVRFVTDRDALLSADLVILPGSKSVLSDLRWLRGRGLDEAIRTRSARGAPTLGICGGYQMLGAELHDAAGVEGAPGAMTGLGLLPCSTRYGGHKTTRLVRACPSAGLVSNLPDAARGPFEGYEIHVGDVALAPGARPLFAIDGVPEGCIDPTRAVAGTLVHGLLDHDGLRTALLGGLWARRGHTGEFPTSGHRLQREYERLADWIDAHLDGGALRRLADC